MHTGERGTLFSRPYPSESLTMTYSQGHSAFNNLFIIRDGRLMLSSC
jgi:hypothetical protein